jgi:hypothetical protein
MSLNGREFEVGCQRMCVRLQGGAMSCDVKASRYVVQLCDESTNESESGRRGSELSEKLVLWLWL